MTQQEIILSQLNEQQSTVTLEAHDTICRNVANRVQQLQDFARSQDIVFFVGGKKSSNAKVLYNHCLAANPNTVFVSAPEEVDKEMLPNAHCSLEELKVGICGATSTPLWLMESVKEAIENVQRDEE